MEWVEGEGEDGWVKNDKRLKEFRKKNNFFLCVSLYCYMSQ